MFGLNVDGANVNSGIQKGLGAKTKEEVDWLQLVHCFNHRLQLALKDAFSNSAFKLVQEFLNEIYSLYQTSPKRYHKLQRIAEAYGEILPKRTEDYRMRWIDHKLQAMRIGLDYHGPLISHMKSLS